MKPLIEKRCCPCNNDHYTCINCICVKEERTCTNCKAPRCKNRKKEYPIKIIDVDKDGNCLFRCLSKWLHNIEDFHGQIRHDTVNQIENFKEFYETQIEKDRYPNLKEYVKRMRKGTLYVIV